MMTEWLRESENENGRSEGVADLRLSEVIAALSHALDLTEGQPEGHAVRSCLIGMRIAEELGLDADLRSALFYALLLKDLGCSSNAARFSASYNADDHVLKCNLKTTDWCNLSESVRFIAKNVAPSAYVWNRASKFVGVCLDAPKSARQMFETRCERGAEIATLLEFPEETAEAIRHLDEHWDGRGQPLGLRGEEISLPGRILCLSQTVEIFFSRFGPAGLAEMLQRRRGTWFDPALVDIVVSLEEDLPFWREVSRANNLEAVMRHEPEERTLTADEHRLDRVALGFARVVDAKSPWTFRHSEGVAAAAVGIAEELGLPADQVRRLRRAGLLHDLGKLGISNLLLDKPAKLTDDERLIIQRHPEWSERILRRVTSFEDLADWAWSHHERLDGGGYPRGLKAERLPLPVRVLTVADIFDALSAARPYRGEQPLEKVMGILKKDAGRAVCPECVEALEAYVDRRDRGNTETIDAD